MTPLRSALDASAGEALEKETVTGDDVRGRGAAGEKRLQEERAE